MIPVSGLYLNNVEYLRRVVGKEPTKSDPTPHQTLYEYLVYELDSREVVKPRGYKTLEQKKLEWTPEEQDQYKDWPRKENVGMMARMPPSDGSYSWWPVLQVVPKKSSKLYAQVGTQWILFCVYQIGYPQHDGDGEYLEGWVNQYQAVELSGAVAQLATLVAQSQNIGADDNSTAAGGTVESADTEADIEWDLEFGVDEDETMPDQNQDNHDNEDYNFY